MEHKTKSFSLIELLVVAAVVLVTSITVGLFVTSIKTQRNILKQQELMDEVSYVMEYMSRAIRMAKLDSSGCTSVDVFESTGSNIKFKNYSHDCQEFFLDNTDKKLKEDKNGANDLTSDNLQINLFNVHLEGEEPYSSSDMQQPRITLFLDVQHADESSVKLQIQTTISQRDLDIE